MHTFFRRLYPTILGTLLFVILSGFLVVGVIAIHLGNRQVIRQKTSSMESLARTLAPAALDLLRSQAEPSQLQALAESLGRQTSGHVTLMTPSGEPIGDSEQMPIAMASRDNPATHPDVVQARQGRVGSAMRYSTTLRMPLLYVAVPLEERGRSYGVLRLAIPMIEVQSLRVAIQRVVLGGLLIGGIIALVLGLWLTRRISHPITRMTQLAGSIAEGRFDVPVCAASITEVHQLGLALNAMAQSLQQSVASLSAERNQARAIVESMAEGVVALDRQGRILLINPSARVLLELCGHDAVGQSLVEIVRHPEFHDMLRSLLEQPRHLTQEVALFHPKERILRFHGVGSQDGGTSGACVVFVIQDVTEHHRYEQLRREFVANVSHELKSPLTAIRSLTETLLGGALEDPANNRKFVQLIDEEATRLSQLINDLLSLSQIESQAIPLRLERVELCPLVETVIASLQAAIEQRGLTISLGLAPGLCVQADPDRIRQVFANLIDNAIKYNKPRGGITITAIQKQAWVKVIVADTGMGIPTQDLPRIFERFYRVDKARSRELGGTGLGLSIVKHIVEAHGGQVSVESQLHQGSAFSFSLPLTSNLS